MLEHVEPEPTPTTLIGLQSSPRRTFRSLRSIPSALRRAAPAAELACGKVGKYSYIENNK